MQKIFILTLLIIFIPTSYAACFSEIKNAEQVSLRITEEWPLRPFLDDKTKYIQNLANKLISVSEKKFQSKNFDWPSHSWRFLIVRDLSVNAYSIGNGKVYITDGTFNFVKTEAELAAILAHEIAHQLIGHFCRKNNTQQTQVVGSFLQILDHEKEIEADVLAVKILHIANFPVQAIVDVVKRLPSLTNDNAEKQLRIKKLEHQIRKIKKISFSSSAEFIKMTQNSDRDNFF